MHPFETLNHYKNRDSSYFTIKLDKRFPNHLIENPETVHVPAGD
jgi:hypothetical protein